MTTVLHHEGPAQVNLLNTLNRVVFKGSKRFMELNLANTGQDTATYTISVIQIRMNEDGCFETIPEPCPGQRFAGRFIRYFPRSVTLGPGEAQVVKIQLTRSNELKSGEYRSHFYFNALLATKPHGEEKPVIDTTTISVRLTPVFGITISVIIRAGANTAKVNLSDLGLDIINDTIPMIRFIFNRTWNMSVYGNMTVDHNSDKVKTTRIVVANGVAVYAPNTIRRFQFNLNKIPGVDFAPGKLRVTYSASSDVKPVRYAEAESQLR